MISPELRIFLHEFAKMLRTEPECMKPLLGPLMTDDLAPTRCMGVAISIYNRIGMYIELSDVKVDRRIADAVSEVIANSPLKEVIFFDSDACSLRYHGAISDKAKFEILSVLIE